MRSLDPAQSDDLSRAYADALRGLSASPIPFLIGGSHGLMRYLEVERETKDLDVFICPGDIHRTAPIRLWCFAQRKRVDGSRRR